MDAAESSQEGVQAEAALTRSHQNVLAIAQRFPFIGAQRFPLNQQFHANNSFENPPVANSADNANQGIHDRNNQQFNPMGPQLQGVIPQGLPPHQQFHTNQLGNGFEYPATPYLTDNANQGMYDRNNRMEYPPYPAALQHGKMNTSPTPWELSKNDIIGNMITMNNHPSAPHYNNVQLLGQTAHQMGMTTGTMNTMDNYPRGTGDQVFWNNPFYPMNDPSQFPLNGPDQFLPLNGPSQFPPVTGPNQFYPFNDPSQFPLNGPNQFLPFNDPGQFPPVAGSNQFPPVIGSDQVPPVNSSNQHTVGNNQGDMPSSVGDQMDLQQDWALFDANYPLNANYSGPLFPQDAGPRSPLPFGSDPMYASNFEPTATALVPGEADTRSARDFPPNIPNTLASDFRYPQIETPQPSNPSRMHALIQRSGTRMDSARFTNRVHKSIRRKKPAKTQKLQSQIGNNASCESEHLASQTVEAQKDSDADVESEEE
ncbi:hypothetical protein BOTCAL_0261g00190 [Botryotinia calthae]|uniref:Uncharacterized protein n=1 Tax=Botryotinia calthae TaxID=38488 RepID=A0A4Y8CYS1_9HELO|nr:hypothetical protein BOTCAL_0261g00190 [Botryotinia calthae]